MVEYIDRDAAIKEFNKNFGSVSHAVIANRLLAKIPAADVEEVKHGFWMEQTLLGERIWDCSECKTIGSPHWKRCPVCEAKMDGGKENVQGEG